MEVNADHFPVGTYTYGPGTLRHSDAPVRYFYRVGSRTPACDDGLKYLLGYVPYRTERYKVVGTEKGRKFLNAFR